MQRTNIYLTQEQQNAKSTQVLLELGKLAEDFQGKGSAPKDLSSNLDTHVWDENE